MTRLEKWMPRRGLISLVYLLLSFAAAGFCFIIIGKDLLPKTNNGQLQLRIREPDGTRLEKTEQAVKGILNIIDSTVNRNVSISSTYIGLVPSSYGTSNLYIFNSGTNEAVLEVDMNEKFKENLDELKDELRKNIKIKYPSKDFFYRFLKFYILAGGKAGLNLSQHLTLTNLWLMDFPFSVLRSHYLLWAVRQGKDSHEIAKMMSKNYRSVLRFKQHALRPGSIDQKWLKPLKSKYEEWYPNRKNW